MSNDTAAILTQIDEAIEDWSVGPDAMRLNAPEGARQPSRGQRLRAVGSLISAASTAPIHLRMRAAMEDFTRGMAQVATTINRMVESNDALRRMLGLPIHDKHHPRPLCIDGHAYHRRRRNRR